MDLATLQALGLAGGLGMTAGLPSMLGVQGIAGVGSGGPTGAELPANSPLHGTVKAWMDDKGFGFVTPIQGGPDVFVHKNQLTDGERLVQGSTVTFECRCNPSRRKYEATSCHGAAAAGAVQPPMQQMPQQTIGSSGVPVPPPAPVRGMGEYDAAGQEARDKDNLFVAGLPMDYNEDRVKDLFSQYGTVTQCKLLPDQPGKNDKAALVRFQDENQAKWMVQNMHGNIPVGMTTPLIVRYAGERGGKLGGAPSPAPAAYGKAAGAVQDNRFSPYGAMGGGVDPNLAAALMSLVGVPQAQTAQAGQLDAATLALLAAQGMGTGATAATGQQPAFDANALAAAAAGATAQAAITSGADAGAAQTAAAGGQQQAAGAAPAAGGSWAEATDPSSGKTYYYHTVTRETRWEKPA